MAHASELHPTMGDLLSRVSNENEIKVGDTVKGKIIFLAKNEALLDIENVGLGVVRGKELYNEEYLSRLKIGEEVEAIVLEMDNERGMLELSFRAIGRDKIWSEISQAYESKTTIEAKIRDANRGGFLIKVHGIDGFLPASLLSPAHAIKNVGVEEKSLVNQMKKYVGQTFNVKVISINPDADTLIASEKAVSDEIAQVKLQKYKVGDAIEGVIVGTVDFGIFIRFDEDLEGLIHISEIAWKKVEDPRKDFKVGQKIKAKIVDIDKDNRINLSIKQLLPNPWIAFSKGTKPGDTFTGTVAKIVSYGAIVVNEDDIQGLCHISQMSETALESPAKIHDLLKVGESREFTVLSLEADEKLYLTMLDFETAMKIQETLVQKQETTKEERDSEKAVEEQVTESQASQSEVSA